MTPRRRSPTRRTSERRRKLHEVALLWAGGLTLGWAALAMGVHASTASRWRAREARGEPLAKRRGPHRQTLTVTACSQAVHAVQETHGLIGAEALRHSVPGLTRRTAAEIKRQTCRVLERERRQNAERVTVAAPGIVRGFDSMELCAPGERRRHALIATDGCVPFRTSWAITATYDGPAVVDVLGRDFDTFGPPLVLRLDRFTGHDTPVVHDVLAAYRVLELHGPAHHPRFYGQHERQNLEHRQWMAASPDPRDVDLDRMMCALNGRPRATLGWQSAEQIWWARPRIEVDRQAFAEEVNDRAARIRRLLDVPPATQDLAWRLGLKHTLVRMQFLWIEKGGWC